MMGKLRLIKRKVAIVSIDEVEMYPFNKFSLVKN